MKSYSPLRYPGGKSAMAGLLGAIRDANDLSHTRLAEPFAGGAGASLSLLYLERTGSILINDADRSIHDLWWSLTHRTQQFLQKLQKTRVSMAEWKRQREIYRSTSRTSRLDRGFAAFYLNRCNRSGIIMNGGPIGGVAQKGEWKIDARFNREELLSRCARIGEYRSRIAVSGKDGIEFICSNIDGKTFFFIDPPYYEKGQTLYLNAIDHDYHERLALTLRTKYDEPWVLTYDDCPEIRRMYAGWAKIRPFSLRYTASNRGLGKEVLITPKWVKLPSEQLSKTVVW